MRRSSGADLRYWSNELPLDLATGCAAGLGAGVVAGPLGYFAAMRFFHQNRTLEPSQHQSASIFLGLFAALTAAVITAILVFLFRYFRRLYRNPL